MTDVTEDQSERELCNQSFACWCVPSVLTPQLSPSAQKGSGSSSGHKLPASPANKGCSVWAAGVSCSPASSSGLSTREDPTPQPKQRCSTQLFQILCNCFFSFLIYKTPFQHPTPQRGGKLSHNQKQRTSFSTWWKPIHTFIMCVTDFFLVHECTCTCAPQGPVSIF